MNLASPNVMIWPFLRNDHSWLLLCKMFMHFFSIEFRANIFILMDIMIFHIIIQKIISLVFIIGFPFSLIFISHFQNPIIFINDFSSSISHDFQWNLNHKYKSFFIITYIYKSLFSSHFHSIKMLMFSWFFKHFQAFFICRLELQLRYFHLCLQVIFAPPYP